MLQTVSIFFHPMIRRIYNIATRLHRWVRSNNPVLRPLNRHRSYTDKPTNSENIEVTVCIQHPKNELRHNNIRIEEF